MKPLTVIALVLTVSAVVFVLTWQIQEKRFDAYLTEYEEYVFRDTVVVHDTITAFPPAEVKPNPVRVVVVKDPMQGKRIDSLITSGASKDSLIRELGSGWYVEQNWNTTKDSAYIVGRLHVTYFPPERHMESAVLVDSVAIPVRIITITQTIETDRISWPWVMIGTGVGLMVGAYAVHEMHKE